MKPYKGINYKTKNKSKTGRWAGRGAALREP
jgi:hypothetical protein